jgi:hypothetical protein
VTRFSVGTMLIATAAVCLALAVTVSNCADYQREYSRVDGHVFDLIVFHRYCVLWLVACVASLGVAIKSHKWDIRVVAIVFAIYAFMACAINFIAPLGTL